MNKIICDVCGTSYPETASQCPICGCAKPADAQAVSGDLSGAEGSAAGTYTYVKGGRFSKSNVRKRNNSTPVYKEQRENDPAPVKQKSNSNTPLIVAAVLLVLAIIAMLCYIYFAYFAPQKPDINPPKPGETTTAAPTTTAEPTQTQAATTTAPQQIKCTELKLSENSIQLDAVGNAWLMNVTPVPADTTDVVTYSTSDPNVATVTAEGRVTAVGPGNAVITVYCGDVTATCNVTCNIAEPTTEPTTAPTTAPPKDELKLNRTDFTLFAVGETWTLYRGNISLTQITWSSDDESVATFDNGVVTAVGPGWTYVYAEYNGQKVRCTVHCNIKTAEGATTEPTQPEQGTTEPTTGENTQDAGYHISDADGDATIAVGRAFYLQLIDNATGKPVEVTWTSSNDGICTINGDVIRGTAVGKTIVSCTYKGKTYSCIVRVKN